MILKLVSDTRNFSYSSNDSDRENLSPSSSTFFPKSSLKNVLKETVQNTQTSKGKKCQKMLYKMIHSCLVWVQNAFVTLLPLSSIGFLAFPGHHHHHPVRSLWLVFPLLFFRHTHSTPKLLHCVCCSDQFKSCSQGWRPRSYKETSWGKSCVRGGDFSEEEEEGHTDLSRRQTWLFFSPSNRPRQPRKEKICSLSPLTSWWWWEEHVERRRGGGSPSK